MRPFMFAAMGLIALTLLMPGTPMLGIPIPVRSIIIVFVITRTPFGHERRLARPSGVPRLS